jgi:hypothetical protein
VSTETPAASPSPLLSVVVPVHDVETWLPECLDTIAAQRVDLEVIVVDDHSADDSLAVARRHAAGDPRFRVIEAVERGGAAARDLGVSLARGRYLVFADGDDLVPRGAYAALVGALESSGDDLAVGDFLKFDARSTWRPSAAFDAFAADRSGVTLGDVPSLLRFRAIWHKMFRLDHWRSLEMRFPAVPRSNDIVPMTTMLTGASSISVVTDVVYAYRDRPGHGSMTRQAGQLTGTVSYFAQEARCAALVTADGREAVGDEYFSMVLVNDGWVHLKKLMTQGRLDIDVESARSLGDSVATIVDAAPSALVDRLGRTQRLLYRIVSAGRADLLWSLPDVPGSSDAVPDDATEAARALDRALDLVALLDGPADDVPRAAVIDRRVVPHLVRLAGTPSAEAREAVVAAARRLPTERVSPQSAAVLRLAREGRWDDLGELATTMRDRRVDVVAFDGATPVVRATGTAGSLSVVLRHDGGEVASWVELEAGSRVAAPLPRRVRRTPGRWSAQLRVRLGDAIADVPALVSEGAVQRPDGALVPVVVAQADGSDSELVFITRSRLVRRVVGALVRQGRTQATRLRR